MFFSRLNWSIPANPLAKLLADKRASGAAILDLTESNPTSPGPTYPADRILAALINRRQRVLEHLGCASAAQGGGSLIAPLAWTLFGEKREKVLHVKQCLVYC